MNTHIHARIHTQTRTRTHARTRTHTYKHNKFNKRIYQYYTNFSDVVTSIKVIPIKKKKKKKKKIGGTRTPKWYVVK